jgi:hypothetical protein
MLRVSGCYFSIMPPLLLAYPTITSFIGALLVAAVISFNLTLYVPKLSNVPMTAILC